ncbi:hypothetical protein Cgig2_027226 [Carnegiea gigantea]|uniref:Reverse transcriptase domain-containing protein n=1 Tax=Carnegiea gigantea TaxID=171969 RepID=A0A9Q1K5B9_9CARY|nr:hypothetical protein Cgig2_027226 [Carnegiea gigantea]
MDVLKNFMTTMTNTLLQQVAEQVKRTMEVESSMRPLPMFNYKPTRGCKSSLRCDHAGLQHKRILIEIKLHPMLKKPQPMNAALTQNNVHKYCEFREQNGHTTAECRELKKALYELADKWQIDRFLEGCPRAFHKDPARACEEPQEEDCSTEIMATITRI